MKSLRALQGSVRGGRHRLHVFPGLAPHGLQRTNQLKRLGKAVNRPADVVSILPSERSITRLFGAILFERTDEGRTRYGYMQL